MPAKHFHFKASKFMSTPSTIHWLVCSALCLLVPIAYAQNAELATKSEKTVGFTLSSYKYEEPSYMTLKAN